MDNVGELNEVQSSLHANYDTRLTSTELGNLWTTYATYSTIARFFEHFTRNVEDKDIRALMQETLQIMDTRVNLVTDIFNQEGRVLPIGFSKKDLRLDAPRLYQDVFYLFYLRDLCNIQLPTNSMFLTTSVRADVRDLYHYFTKISMDIFQKTTDIMLSKGILIRPPIVPMVDKVDFVKEKNFLTGFLGEKRPLLALEISSLHYLVYSNYIGKSLLLGFKQVAEAKHVRDFMDRGIKLAAKIMDTYESFLAKEDIPVPMYWDSMVTDSTTAPFSDKMMVFHVSVLNAAGLANMGAALSTSLRHDVSASYLKTLADIMNYAADGANLMIANGWLEEPPRHIDRREITDLKH